MLQDFPRLTILYYRFLHYDGVFLPFMQTVIDKPQHCEQLESHGDFHDDSSKCSQVSVLCCRMLSHQCTFSGIYQITLMEYTAI
jgi:hypothetical protein